MSTFFHKNLRAKIIRYLNSSSSDRKTIQEIIKYLTTHFYDTVIFGGMIRDLALFGAKGFNSDIDIVIDTDPTTLKEIIDARYKTKTNRFGGLKLLVEKQRLDIWPLCETWAIKQGYIKQNGIASLPNTTFFNYDAIVYHVTKKKLIYKKHYFEDISKRVLDINLEPNPNPQFMALKALRTLQGRDIAISLRLAIYITQHISQENLRIGDKKIFDEISQYVERTLSSEYFTPTQNSLPLPLPPSQ